MMTESSMILQPHYIHYAILKSRFSFGWVDGISQPIVIGLDTDAKVEEAKKGLKPIQAG
jgi:hypothetical protein